MPSIGIKLLSHLAQSSSHSSAVKSRALEALSRTDANQGKDILINALYGDDAVTAIYVFNNIIKYLDDDEALNILTSIPFKQLTVTKEILRLIGNLNTNDAYEYLMRFKETNDLHQDVEISLLRALWNYLDHDDVWTYFEEVSKSEKPTIVATTINIPQEGLDSKGKRNLTHHLSKLLKHPDKRIVNQTLFRLINQPTNVKDDELYKNIEALISDNTEIRYQADRALISSFAKTDAQKVSQSFLALENPIHIKSAIEAFKNHQSPFTNECAYLFAYGLVKEKNLGSLAISLAFNNLSVRQTIHIFDTLEEEHKLHGGLVSRAEASVQKIIDNNPKDTIEELENHLYNSSHEVSNVIGLMLLEALMKVTGYEKHSIEKLNQYKDKSSQWVKEYASLIEIPYN